MGRRFLPVALIVGVAVATVAVAQDAGCPAPSSTFELIQRGVFEQHDCTLSYCHGENKAAGLDLRAGQSYGNLLAEASSGNPSDPEGHEAKLVDPRRPKKSLLWRTLAAKTLRLNGLSGTPMPAAGLPLSRDELNGIRLWILAGAPETGFVSRVANLIQACPPPSPAEEAEVPPPCSADDQDLLLPDLVPDPPGNVRVAYYPGVEVQRRIEFNTALANRGDGPLIVQAASRPTAPGQSLDAVQIILRKDGSKCSRPVGEMFFETEGRHWAYANLVDFELRVDDPFTGQVVARTSKTFFCLVDTDPIRGLPRRPHQFEAHCKDDIGRMGISAGYKDVYNRFLPGQWIDLDADPSTSVPPGKYYLVNVVDPNRTFSVVNSAPEGNVSYTRVTIKLPDPDAPRAAQTAR